MQIRPTGPAPAKIMKIQPVDRILSRSHLLSPTGCLIWEGGADSRNYGMISVNGMPTYTHRVVYEHFHRQLIPGEVVRHTCDRSRCCNPEHLLAGTRGDNVRDAFERGQLKVKVSSEVVQKLRAGELTIKEAVAVTGATYKHLYNVKLGHKR